MLKLAVLVSGGGTNLQAIIDAMESGAIQNAKIELVISNNKNAYALERAARHQIPARCISPRDYNSREQFNEELLETLQKAQVLSLIHILPSVRQGESQRKQAIPGHGAGYRLFLLCHVFYKFVLIHESGV